MKQTKILMGMPITIEILDENVSNRDINDIFKFFNYVDKKFSTYKEDSEITKINRGELKKDEYSVDMNTILELCRKTRDETGGYFDIKKEDGIIDPSGIVKGWAIKQASNLILSKGFNNFYIDAGGDIQTHGDKVWRVGIRNPFNRNGNIKILEIKNMGVATSGTYIRGNHIYNPKDRNHIIDDIVSITVIGPDIYEADRFATPVFAMGKEGINFIEKLNGFEGYMIDKKGIATYTSNFNSFTIAS